MKKFEVGKMYKGRYGKECKCTKRTDKSVWLDGNRYEIKTDCKGNEYTTTVIRVTDFKSE